MRVSLQSINHCNADHQQVHGPDADHAQSRRHEAPHLSKFARQLVLSLAQLGLTPPQILGDLQVKKQNKELAGRDAEITDQDIRNIIQHLEQQTWRYDADVATSLRAWVLEHGDWVWMYQEHRSGKPTAHQRPKCFGFSKRGRPACRKLILDFGPAASWWTLLRLRSTPSSKLALTSSSFASRVPF